MNPHKKIIQRNMYIKLDIREIKDTTARNAVEDYRVLAVYTKKAYNKWHLVCDKGKQT